ncbi:hypothetical protein B0T26DRAFT_746129 [Lasiosphaeria miniovina]|uniref:3-hydroxyacyl-CoA dehydrogenase n=1 Tax=Lasiosphaeria miniovina TaxID=1954250 RepID=A0AA40BHL6_9PEZI|nr:uncharacterized protein B0T26DRAFT_746129 [Lasiosphaeria miniovina]KAK0734183.1 hypothetical protein B0T26DRAFT_746129 [Lasiosphaeria miniovina]
MASWELPSPANRPVAILGGGVLGRRIAACWAAAGYRVHIRDPDAKQLTGALQYVKTELWRYKPTVSADRVDVEGFRDLAPAAGDAWLVVECVPEKLGLKIDAFAELEKATRPDAILATNSSSFKSRELTAGVAPDTARRILNAHYVIPPDIRTVELMTSGSTHEAIFPFLQHHLRASGMLPMVAHRESTGFILNRVWAAIKREVLMVVSEGVASPEEVDAAWTEMFIKHGVPPCELMDSVGLDTVSLIEQHYIDERGLRDPGVIAFLQSYIDQGRLGAKCSKGGLYPPGHCTKPPGDEQGPYDNLHAPALYILDIGLANEPGGAFKKGRILLGSADGEAPLRTLVDGQPMPDGIVLCLAAGKMFWTNMGTPGENDGSILSSDLDGGNVQVIVTPGTAHTPKQVAVDQDCQKLYFSDREGMRVLRCNVDGSAVETLVQTGSWRDDGFRDPTLWCVGVALAPRERMLYWTQKGPSKSSQGRIFRAAMDMPAGATAATRTDIECLLAGLPEPVDLEIDEDSRTLYWTDGGELPRGNSLNRVSLDAVDNSGSADGAGGYEILVRNLHEAIGLAIDKKNRHIYATDLGGAVYRFNMNGKDKKKLYEDQGSFGGIALRDR